MRSLNHTNIKKTPKKIFKKHWKQSIKWILIVAMATLIAVLIPLSQVMGQSDACSGTPFCWDYINVDIDLQENGDMLITEKQQYNFQKSYIAIPNLVRYELNYQLDLI